MSNIRFEELLDNRTRTRAWEDFLAVAETFDPLMVEEISCIIPIPDQLGVLIIAENEVFINRHTAAVTLQQFALAHNFPDYSTLCSVLKDTGYFGKYKIPWVCPYFSLCPLEGGTNGVWVNPLKIENIYTVDGLHYIQLLNGVKLISPVKRYPALLRGEIACGILAAIRQENFHFTLLGNRPIDYLTLPNTDFARSLAKRPLLERFVTRKGELHRRYQQARFLHYYDQLEGNPHTLHWENWQ
ncbi:hypothetical protein [Enterococcus sp.]|uniref:hypothetical protein n=1 Tax=Enterococcus sp. TaxID=35783 RepID=UPI002914F16A|nr:hypothetical protein [Enterococcus sp.]MDU5336687.1 hypothetical protein [Enterococcus sp.]